MDWFVEFSASQATSSKVLKEDCKFALKISAVKANDIDITFSSSTSGGNGRGVTILHYYRDTEITVDTSDSTADDTNQPWLSALKFAIVGSKENNTLSEDSALSAITNELYKIPYPYESVVGPSLAGQAFCYDPASFGGGISLFELHVNALC